MWGIFETPNFFNRPFRQLYTIVFVLGPQPELQRHGTNPNSPLSSSFKNFSKLYCPISKVTDQVLHRITVLRRVQHLQKSALRKPGLTKPKNTGERASRRKHRRRSRSPTHKESGDMAFHFEFWDELMPLFSLLFCLLPGAPQHATPHSTDTSDTNAHPFSPPFYDLRLPQSLFYTTPLSTLFVFISFNNVE